MLRSCFLWLCRLPTLPLLGLIAFYRLALSPMMGAHCRYHPTCSGYAREAITRYGACVGGGLALKRILRCHPWGGSGWDPVPDLSHTRWISFTSRGSAPHQPSLDSDAHATE